jgi:ADP-heptose:LPS heptosyltransferase
MRTRDKILVIRLGALGDVVLCFQAFAEIRAAHKDAEIALLTMPAFAALGARMPWFDKVITDPRPSAARPDQWLKLVAAIRCYAPHRVYDLQGKRRQSILFALLGGPFGPEWSGAAPFCSHPRPKVPASGMHFTDYVAAQLRVAGVPAQPYPDLGWLDAPAGNFNLPPRYAVLVPGCAPHREYKRWPPSRYAQLAQKLQERGLAAVAVGTAEDAEAIATIRAQNPAIIDISGRTDLFQLAGVLRRAALVVANDSGPMHMAAALGAPTLGLISERVDAAWIAPRGPQARWRRGDPLAGLDVDKVFLDLGEFLDQKR